MKVINKLTKRLLLKYEKIPNFPGYYAGNDGRVYSEFSDHCKQLTEFRYPFSKFLLVFLYRDSVRFGVHCHKLIASAYFKVNPDRFLIKHKDKDRCNNRPSNLSLIPLTEVEKPEIDSYYKSQIREYEIIFFNNINYDFNNPDYLKYYEIKSKGNIRLLYNFLRLIVNNYNIF